jgi:hypothetical protein
VGTTSAFCVSICTFVLGKQVNLSGQVMTPRWSFLVLYCCFTAALLMLYWAGDEAAVELSGEPSRALPYLDRSPPPLHALWQAGFWKAAKGNRAFIEP